MFCSKRWPSDKPILNNYVFTIRKLTQLFEQTSDKCSKLRWTERKLKYLTTDCCVTIMKSSFHINVNVKTVVN